MSFDRPGFKTFIRDFSPGFLDVPEPDTLPDGATPDARNGWFINRNVAGTDRAKLAKRPGSRLVNPTATVAATKVDSLFEFRRAAGRSFLKVLDGKLWVFDDIDTFTQVGATAPFTGGRAARVEFFRDNAFIHDGTAAKRYDGTTLFDVGQVAPTGVTNMAAVAPAGAGVTGTFEAEYFWYDPVMDHEAGPSSITPVPAVLVAQARRHTQPTGVPAAQYTQWRAYVRRTDINETLFMRVGTWNLASGTHDEEVIDAARRDPAPSLGDHDPPPAAWAILKEWKGFGIGVLPNSSDYFVSATGDLQSWPARNRFSVRKGDGEYLSGVKPFGEDLLLQKPHRTWRLVGDQVPFALTPMHSSYGGVSQESGLEVDGRFFDYDRERGPYVTDGLQWKALADATIRTTIESVNRDGISDIRCVHREGQGLVGWIVPTGASTRKRMLLWYDYLLGCWLPPWTGLEYASLATYTNPAGVTGTYVGDYWGRVFELFSGDRDGVIASAATATLSATVTAGAANTVTAAGATFPTTGSGLAGLRVAAIDPAGNWQWRRVQSNTGTVITLDTTHDTPWTTVPVAGWTVVVGGIEWYHWTRWFHEDAPELKKSLHWLYLQGRTTSDAHRIAIHARLNDAASAINPIDVAFAGSGAGVFGTAIFGISLFGTTSRQMRKHRLERSAFSVQFALSNFYPDQPVTVTSFGFSGDVTETQIASV